MSYPLDDRARIVFADWLSNQTDVSRLWDRRIHRIIEHIAEALATTDAECEHIVELLTKQWDEALRQQEEPAG